MQWLELLKPVDGHAAGEFLEVQPDAYQGYIAAGLGRDGGEGKEAVVLQRVITSLKGEIASITQDVADAMSSAVKGLNEHKRRLHITGGESEADKKRSFGDFVCRVLTVEDRRISLYTEDSRNEARRLLTTPWGEGGYRDELAIQRANIEGAGAAGGFLTPVVYEQQLLELEGEEAVFSSQCLAVPLGARDVEWPALNQYTVPTAGQSATFAGVQTFYKGETVVRTEADPSFTKVKLTAQDLTAYIQYSRDLMQDAPAFTSYITRMVGGAIKFREDWEFINGNGAGRPLGFLNAPALLTVATRAATGHIGYADVTAMEKLLHPAYQSRAIWLAHPFAKTELRNMVDGASRLIWQPNYPGVEYGPAGAKAPESLLGYPLYYSEKLPPVGTQGDINLVVPKTYLKGTRAGVEIGISDQYAFPQDEIALRAKLRHDGQPWLKAAYVLADGAGTNVVSTFINLHA